jgi:hypothetical protein
MLTNILLERKLDHPPEKSDNSQLSLKRSTKKTVLTNIMSSLNAKSTNQFSKFVINYKKADYFWER